MSDEMSTCVPIAPAATPARISRTAGWYRRFCITAIVRPAACRRPDERDRLRQVQGQRLLDDDVAAGCDRGLGDRSVERRRGEVDDEIRALRGDRRRQVG